MSHSHLQKYICYKKYINSYNFHTQNLTKGCGYIMFNVLNELKEYFQ